MRFFQSFKHQMLSLPVWLKIFLLGFPWLIFFMLIPPFHIPDEYSHYTYIQALAHGNYPYLSKNDCWSEEVHLFADRYKDDFSTILYAPRVNQLIPVGMNDTAVCSTQAQHPPLYYLVGTLIYRIASFFGITGLFRYNLVRLTSLAFFALFLVYLEKLFGLFFDKKLANWMRVLVVFQPLLLSLATNVNPEMAVIALATVTLYYLSLFLMSTHFSFSQVAVLSFLCVATFYSKITGFIMVPLTVFAIVFLTQTTWLRKFQQLVFFLGIVVVLVSPYLLWNYHLYGKLLENGLMYLGASTQFPTKISYVMKASYLLDDVRIALLQTSGDIGKLDAPMFAEIKIVYIFVLLFLFVFGVYASFAESPSEVRWVKHRWLFGAHVLLAFSFFVYLGYEYMRLAWLGPLLQVRYIFLSLSSFLLFFLLGALRLFNVNQYSLVKFLLLISIIHFNIVVLWSIIPRFYI